MSIITEEIDRLERVSMSKMRLIEGDEHNESARIYFKLGYLSGLEDARALRATIVKLLDRDEL